MRNQSYIAPKPLKTGPNGFLADTVEALASPRLRSGLPSFHSHSGFSDCGLTLGFRDCRSGMKVKQTGFEDGGLGRSIRHQRGLAAGCGQGLGNCG